MNDLSLFLYLADVLSSLGTLLILLSVVGLFACGIMIIVGIIGMNDNRRYNSDTALDRDYTSGKAWFQRGTKLLWIPILGLVVGMMLPSTRTMHMIAASELGEEAAQTPEFLKARKMLNKYLDEQLQEEPN